MPDMTMASNETMLEILQSLRLAISQGNVKSFYLSKNSLFLFKINK